MLPAFAVGRAQTVMHLLARLRRDGRIPAVPTFLNSPMAVNATELFLASPAEHRLTKHELAELSSGVEFVRSVQESKQLTSRSGPMIVLSASGALEMDHFPAGAVGVVSQSGGILGSLLSRASARGIGLSKLVSTSNEVDLELADFIGLDVLLAILNVLHSEIGDPKYRPCPLLKKHVEAGWLGRKSGRGFYTY